uniref:Uncharacterized protein n=1 Tax=Tanacetum cinerariifolium TaxID=118510 RepID=A0A699ILN3_TANCI|nr:hypothetical protein [Tanacetum cinerariifolium]
MIYLRIAKVDWTVVVWGPFGVLKSESDGCLSDIPHADAEIISTMDVHVHHKVLSSQIPTLFTVLVYVITDSSPVYSTVILQSLPSFTPPPQQSTLTPPPITKATNPPSVLPNFASVFQFNNKATKLETEVVELKKDDLLNTQKRSRKDKDKDEDPSAGSNRGLKKRKTSKDDEPTKGPKAKESKSGSSKGTKSQSKSFGKYVHAEEPEFKVAYF